MWSFYITELKTRVPLIHPSMSCRSFKYYCLLLSFFTNIAINIFIYIQFTTSHSVALTGELNFGWILYTIIFVKDLKKNGPGGTSMIYILGLLVIAVPWAVKVLLSCLVGCLHEGGQRCVRVWECSLSHRIILLLLCSKTSIFY